MSDQTCATGCGRPTERSLCDQCLWKVEQALAEMPALVEELTTTLTKQARVSAGKDGGKPTKGKVQPLPFDIQASKVLADIRVVLFGWVMDIYESAATIGPTCETCVHGTCEAIRWHRLPADTLPAMAAWLQARLDVIAAHKAADDIHDEVTDAAAAGWRCVDLAAERVFVGMCSHRESPDQEPCPEELMAKRNALLVRCRTCGTEYSVEERRKVLRDAVEDVLATPAEISRAVQWVGEAVRLDQITRWVQAERLAEKGHVMQGKRRMALYRIGDVIELLKEPDRRKKPA